MSRRRSSSTTRDVATDAIARLRERGAGRGAFITLDYEAAGEGGRRGDAKYAVVGEGPVADAVRRAMPEAYIVGTLGEALDRSKERPSATFVTLEGDIVRGPLVIGGKSENATPGVFSLKRQLSDLEALLGTEETRASGIAAELQTIEEDLRAADDARILAEERARAAEQELRERRSNRERANQELDRFERDLAVASEEQTLYAEEKEQLIARKNAAIADLQQLEAAGERVPGADPAARRAADQSALDVRGGDGGGVEGARRRRSVGRQRERDPARAREPFAHRDLPRRRARRSSSRRSSRWRASARRRKRRWSVRAVSSTSR